MKKFKLIKKYPGSPKLGTKLTPKVDKENTDTNNFYWEGSWFNPNDFHEFWEEIIEKNYEILEIQGKYGSISSYIEEYDSDLKNKFIYKIKRLSDGEIFTIGNIVTGNSNIRYNISSFVINKRFNKIIINGSDIHLDECKKEKLLFITEDNVNIFEGDKYSVIDILENRYKVMYNTTISGSKSSRYILISTKEKAEEYILMNKPCLSYKEASDIMLHHDISAYYKKTIREKLKELVKQKLNQ